MASTVSWVVYNTSAVAMATPTGGTNIYYPQSPYSSVSNINFDRGDYTGLNAGATSNIPMIYNGNSYSFWAGISHDGTFSSLVNGSYLIKLPSLPSGVQIVGSLSKVFQSLVSSSWTTFYGGDYTAPTTSSTGDPALYNGQVFTLYGMWKSGNNNIIGSYGSFPFDNGSGNMGMYNYPVTFDNLGGASVDVAPFWTIPIRLQLQVSGPTPKSVINVNNFINYYWSET